MDVAGDRSANAYSEWAVIGPNAGEVGVVDDDEVREWRKRNLTLAFAQPFVGCVGVRHPAPVEDGVRCARCLVVAVGANDGHDGEDEWNDGGCYYYSDSPRVL